MTQDDNMNQDKKKEALEQVRVKFSRLCTKYGHVNYQIAVLSRDKAMIEDELSNLNMEAAQIEASGVKDNG